MVHRLLACVAVLLALLPAPPAAAEPALWRIRQGATEIDLFGTMHELPPGIDWLSPRIAAAVDASDTLVLELVAPDDPSVIVGLIGRLGYSPNEPKLAARVAPSKRAQLDRAIAATRLSIDRLDPMETWLASIVLGDATLARFGLAAANGVETTLTARVRARGAAVIGLETMEQQLSFFDTLPETDQRQLLDGTVDDTVTAEADTAKLLKAWTGGDTATIADSFRGDSFNASPLTRRVLITERNARWADWITSRLRQPGHVFIAVGAAHLAGSESVVALLAARGIVAERLN